MPIAPRISFLEEVEEETNAAMPPGKQRLKIVVSRYCYPLMGLD